ncbi:transcription factor SPT20 homolog [Arvicola amphibius]|uniref:transcription factor SPT20 homolog n=1 Tax=Arvicola amphibius TaxID=1047088 RepID=UPI001C0A579E|nr:transcription factor SPT20 homolog [Arvicola amphibius]
MEQTLQDTLEGADDTTETVQQQPPPTSTEKSLQEKLYDIYVEECEKEPEAEGLGSNVNLLEKLMEREPLPCLVVSLYPENQGYSLMLRDKDGVLIEPNPGPYVGQKLLEYLDAEELPFFLIDILEKSPVNVFHSGCVIAQIRDYRQCGDIYPPKEPAAEAAVSSPACQVRHILLCPTMQSLVSDVESITSNSSQCTQEEKVKLESQLTSATAEPLCLDPSVAATCTTNKLLFNEQKMNTNPMRQCLKRHACPSLDQEEGPSGCSCPPDFTTMTPFKKQAKISPDNPSELQVDGTETCKQSLCEPTVPSEMDMESFVKEMLSLPFDETETTVSAIPEVKYDCMFDCEDDSQLWDMSTDIMECLNTLFSDEIEPLAEDGSANPMSLPPVPLGDDSDDFLTGINTEPRKTVAMCQESVESKASCSGKMPQGSSSSVCPPQPTTGKKPTASLVPLSVLEKESKTLPVSRAPISGQGPSSLRLVTPEARRDPPPAPQAVTVAQQTTVGKSRVSTAPSAVQPSSRSSENNPKIQPPTRATHVNVSHLVRSAFMGNSTRVPVCPPRASAAEGTSHNNLIPTREQTPRPAQRSVRTPVQIIINNTSNSICVRVPPGAIVFHPDSQKPPQQPLQYPQQAFVLIPKQHQPPRAPVPQQPQPQPGPAASSQGSNPQQASLPAQQTSRLNTEGPRVVQQTQTSVGYQVSSTPQSHRQNVQSQGFQVYTTMVQQGQRQGPTQSLHVRIIRHIVTVSRADIQYSACENAAREPSDRGMGGPPNPPRP